MNDDDLCYVSATDALARFRARTLSPVELMEAIICRAESIAGTVNPFADRYFDETMERAKAAETKYARTDGRLRRLEGLPLVVKDSSRIRGRRSTNGSMINKDRVDQSTDPAIERLLRSGANLFARTTCPEFCWLFTCHSRMWGVTRNPWRLDATPGGSSGGSAAALAAGATTIATGGDSTGSIRQPASQCGVVGYKPPYGRMPLSPSLSFDPFVQVGPMTRSVADAALMSNVMSGPHPLDHATLPSKLTIPEHPAGVKGMKVAYSVDLGHYEVVDDVRREFKASLDALSDAGAEIVEVQIDGLSETIRLAHGAQEFMAASNLQEVIDKHADVVSDYVPELVETALSYGADDYRRSQTLAGEVWHDCLGPVFHKFDAFVCPTVSTPEVPAENWQKHEIIVNGQRLTDTDIAMTALFNLYSRCPVLAVPGGMTDAGLPCGLQIVGRPCDDIAVFRVAHALERERPWLNAPSRRPSLATMTAPAPSG
ncbi:MAG: amidase [Gammaproteobacteria bacterium]|nr:MAG: amidase [Gammaproteobacteria bacterium]